MSEDLALLGQLERCHVEVLDEGKPIECGSRMVLPFRATISPRTTIIVVQQPQLAFRPLRLVYGGPSGIFVLQDIMVGKNSQFLSMSGVPMECYPPHVGEGKPFNNLEGFDLCYQQMMIILRVENVTDSVQDFGCMMYGEVFR